MKRILRLIPVLFAILCFMHIALAAEDTLTFPQNIKTIEREAFFGVSGISSAVLPEGLESIESLAFANSSLDEITLPDSLSHIADNAFDDCSGLHIFAPEGSYAYQWADGKGFQLNDELVCNPADFTYEIVDGEAVITGYTGSDSAVTIPAVLDGYPVTAIGSWGLCYSDFTSIELPSSIVKIDDYAFYYCNFLETIVIPQSVAMIGEGAFSECPSLKKITLDSANDFFKVMGNALFSMDGSRLLVYFNGSTQTHYAIPEGVTQIDPSAFYRCSSLQELTIPASLTSLDSLSNLAFSWAETLSAYHVAPNHPSFLSCDGVLYSADGTQLLYYPYGKKNTAFSIPEGVTSINDLSSLHLVELSLPASLTSIDPYALSGASLTSIHVDSANKVFRSLDGVLYNGDGTHLLWYPTGRQNKHFTVPDGVTHIEERSFDAHEYISSVTLPNSIVSIGDFAFCYTNLTDINLPENLTYLGSGAFSQCESLNNVILPDNLTCIKSQTFFWCSSLTEIQIPPSVTSIEHSAFDGCSNLKSIDLPENLISIGDDAFYGCQSLISVELPSSLTEIGSWAFSNCINLINIDLPSTLTYLGGGVFRNCSSLQAIEIPDSLTSYGELDFSGCSSLVSVRLSNNMYHIPDLAFDGCASLESISFTLNLYRIGEYAFRGCSKLKNIFLPANVREISSNAFEGCTSLQITASNDSHALQWALDHGFSTEIFPFGYRYASDNTIEITSYSGKDSIAIVPCYIGNYQVTHINSYAFAGCTSLTSIVLPEGIASIGNFAFSHCSSLTNIVLPDGITSIGNNTFEQCSSLTSVVLPEGITSIGNSAFAQCSNLTSVVLPEGITSIGNSAFAQCSSLISIVLPDGITSIANNTFEQCSSLASVVLPEGITSIGNYAFSHCSSLASIVLPEGLTGIGRFAFSYCKSLTSVVVPKGITTIDVATFNYCTSLTSVVLPDGLKRIEWDAFYACSSLPNIVVPEGVTSIGDYAFAFCNNLSRIYLPSSQPGIGFFAFVYDGYTGESIPNLVVECPDWYAAEYYRIYVSSSVVIKPFSSLGGNSYSAPGRYEIVDTFLVNGKTYYSAELLSAYNGVSPSTHSTYKHFFLDSNYHVVVDPEIMCKLWTMYRYVDCQNIIRQDFKNWSDASQIWSKSAVDFLNDEQLVKTIGEAGGSLIESLATGGSSAVSNVVNYIASNASNSDLISTLMQTSVICQQVSNIVSVSEDALSYSVKNLKNAYVYDRIVVLLDTYKYVAASYESAKSICIPIVENIIDKYSADWKVALHHMLEGFRSFATSGAPFLKPFNTFMSIMTNVSESGSPDSMGFINLLGDMLSFFDEYTAIINGVGYFTGVLDAMTTMYNIDIEAIETQYNMEYFKDINFILSSVFYQQQLALAK